MSMASKDGERQEPQATNTDKPEASTAVATIPKQSIEQILLQRVEPTEVMQAYEAASQVQRSKITAEAAGTIAQISWGKELPQDVRFQVARWCLAHRVDPHRHITVLGGTIYDCAEYYMDKCAELGIVSKAERIVMAPLDRRNIDAALVGDQAAAELRSLQLGVNKARLEMQIRYGLPDDINEHPNTAAVLIRLHLRDGRSFEGWNMAGSRGRKTRNGKPTDPIGDQEPVKTATTRAWRKAAKDFIPFAAETFKDEGVGLEEIEQRLADERERTKRIEAEGPQAGDPVKHREIAPGVPFRQDAHEVNHVRPPVDPYAKPSPDVDLICDNCDNTDSAPVELVGENPPCTTGCGGTMRPNTGEPQEDDQTILDEDKELAKE